MKRFCLCSLPPKRFDIFALGELRISARSTRVHAIIFSVVYMSKIFSGASVL